MYKTILVAVDGSDGSLQAARTAALLAKRSGACVMLVSVFDPATYSPSYYGAWELTGEIQSADDIASEILDNVERRSLPVFQDAGITSEMIRERGHPADRIVKTAHDFDADLVVMGSRGMGGWQALVVGSVSTGVLHHAPCPVLIARGEAKPFERILLGADGSEGSRKATDAAIGLAKQFDAQLTALNVCKSMRPVGKEALESVGSRAQKRILDFVAQSTETLLKEANLAPSIRQEEGEPAEVITRVAADEGFDLIVLGSRGMGGFGSLLLGSVSDKVVRHARCPVLVVR